MTTNELSVQQQGATAPRPALLPASLPILPKEVMSLIADNGPLMFPADGSPSYHSGWSVPKTIPAALAEKLPGLLQMVERSLIAAPATAIGLALTELSVHYWEKDRPQGHFKSLARDYLEDLSHVPPDILAEGIRQYRRNAVWFPKVAELLAIVNPMIDQRKREADRLRRLIAAQKDGGTVAQQPERKGKRWSEMTDEEKAAHDKRMAEIGGPKSIGDVLQQQAKGTTDA